MGLPTRAKMEKRTAMFCSEYRLVQGRKTIIDWCYIDSFYEKYKQLGWKQRAAGSTVFEKS